MSFIQSIQSKHELNSHNFNNKQNNSKMASELSIDTLQHFDLKKHTMVLTDAKMKHLGACILHEDHPVYYALKSLPKTEKKYSNREREVLAVILTLQKFFSYTNGL